MTYRLNLGTIKNPHSEQDHKSTHERLCHMWAYRLCDHPELAWFNDSRDPGIVTNVGFTWEKFLKFPVLVQNRIREIITEQDELTADTYGQTIDEAVKKLVAQASRAKNYISQDNLEETDNRNLFLIERLEFAICNVNEWIANIEEENSSPMKKGWVSSRGTP